MQMQLAAGKVKRQTASILPGGSRLLLQETPLVKVKRVTSEAGWAGGRCDQGKPWLPDTPGRAGQRLKEPQMPLPVTLSSVLLLLCHFRNCDGEILKVIMVRLS